MYQYGREILPHYSDHQFHLCRELTQCFRRDSRMSYKNIRGAAAIIVIFHLRRPLPYFLIQLIPD